MREWLPQARTASGMTQAQVAKQLDISESYYSFIEKGERQKKMDVTLVAKLSSIFKIPIEQIVELEKKSG